MAQIQAMADRSPHVQQLMKLQEMADNSPLHAAMVQPSGPTVQRQDGLDEDELQPKAMQKQEPEEEELLQGKMEPAQRQEDLEEDEPLQGKTDPVQRQDLDDEEPLQGRFADRDMPLQRQPPDKAALNHTGMPDQLKSGLEQLSRLDLSDVRVHRNSPKPANVGALAYAQGRNIHLSPGQEQHLPHEGWHVVQQMQGRVRPTMETKGVAINDDERLEKEADVMGAQSERLVSSEGLNVAVSEYSAKIYDLPDTVVQRQIQVSRVDFNPLDNEDRHGRINEDNFYNSLRTSINDDNAIDQLYKNQLNNVINAVRQNNFSNPDIPSLTDAIVTSIVAAYAPGLVIAANLVRQHVETALLANIQRNDALAMDNAEADGFTRLSQANGVVMSRTKGVPSTIDYASLPQPIDDEVTRRLNEIRTERALWTVAAVIPGHCLPNNTWAADICARQVANHYQGNHTNNAGWLPTVAPPADSVSTIGTRVYDAARKGLKKRLIGPDPLTKLGIVGAGVGQHNKHRDEFNQLSAALLNDLGDAGVKLSAMAALCQNVSAYIEFSMAGGISRLVFDPVNSRVYITAHYKWHNGYNPFFEVLNFPAV